MGKFNGTKGVTFDAEFICISYILIKGSGTFFIVSSAVCTNGIF